MAAVGIALMLAACATPPRDDGGRLSADMFEDIPAPESAVYVTRDNRSFSYRSSTFRCGKFVYEYQGSADDVTRFYAETMANPPYSWTLSATESPGSGSTTLVFTKNDDRCTVDIDRVPRPNIDKKNNIEIRVRVNYRG
jgi:hypothetical protein